MHAHAPIDQPVHQPRLAHFSLELVIAVCKRLQERRCGVGNVDRCEGPQSVEVRCVGGGGGGGR
eukprot:28281-Eustigmatos_ZCMA.PRE.1